MPKHNASKIQSTLDESNRLLLAEIAAAMSLTPSQYIRAAVMAAIYKDIKSVKSAQKLI